MPMSRRPLLSRLLSYCRPRPKAVTSGVAHTRAYSWRYYLLRFFLLAAMLLSALWLLTALWFQFGTASAVTWLAAVLFVGLVMAIFTTLYQQHGQHRQHGHDDDTHLVEGGGALSSELLRTPRLFSAPVKRLTAAYTAVWLLGLGWFVSITPQQTRDWQPEVSQMLSYERDPVHPNLITLSNVRNFDWHSEDDATPRWETRTIDLSKLSGVDVVNSYWMGPLIAHTLVSFRFEDDRPLAFSLEIRKENGESFSALGGFFKRFELSLIAAEERDIIYTRSNVRGEQVYVFPVSHLRQHEVRGLFESYLRVTDELNAKPAWYNTLTSNCTNLIFYMARVVSGERLPWDYRVWVSGWLPNYLYDLGMLDARLPQNSDSDIDNVTTTAPKQPRWSMDTWYERAHINPKSSGFNNVHSDDNSRAFSQQIRQGIPLPPLADSKIAAEKDAQSMAVVSNE